MRLIIVSVAQHCPLFGGGGGNLLCFNIYILYLLYTIADSGGYLHFAHSCGPWFGLRRPPRVLCVLSEIAREQWNFDLRLIVNSCHSVKWVRAHTWILSWLMGVAFGAHSATVSQKNSSQNWRKSFTKKTIEITKKQLQFFKPIWNQKKKPTTPIIKYTI